MNTLIRNILYWDLNDLSCDELRLICSHKELFVKPENFLKFQSKLSKIPTDSLYDDSIKDSLKSLINEFYNYSTALEDIYYNTNKKNEDIPLPLEIIADRLSHFDINEMFYFLDSIDSHKYVFIKRRCEFYNKINVLLCDTLGLADTYDIFGVRSKTRLYESLSLDYSSVDPKIFIPIIVEYLTDEVLPLIKALDHSANLPYYITVALKEHLILRQEVLMRFHLREGNITQEFYDNFDFGKAAIEYRKLGKYDRKK